jgi:hypothetical protein
VATHVKGLSGSELVDLLANQRVHFDEHYSGEWNALDCLRLADGSLLARHRNGRCEHFVEAPALETQMVEGDGLVGSLLTELAFPADFPCGVESLLQQLFADLAISQDCALPALTTKLAKLTRVRYRRTLVLTYGELLRRNLAGSWLGITHDDGTEPALVSASRGLVRFAGNVSKLATKTHLPDFAMILHLAGPPPFVPDPRK